MYPFWSKGFAHVLAFARSLDFHTCVIKMGCKGSKQTSSVAAKGEPEKTILVSESQAKAAVTETAVTETLIAFCKRADVKTTVIEPAAADTAVEETSEKVAPEVLATDPAICESKVEVVDVPAADDADVAGTVTLDDESAIEPPKSVGCWARCA